MVVAARRREMGEGVAEVLGLVRQQGEAVLWLMERRSPSLAMGEKSELLPWCSGSTPAGARP